MKKSDTFTLREGFSFQPVPQDKRELMNGRTFHENKHIGYDDLSYLNVKYYDFEHHIAQGEMVVNRKLAHDVLEIFAELFDAGYELEKVRLCDFYDGDDDRCMQDNNTSSFNYRVIADTDNLSLHALGMAIDINPLYNPYIVGEKVMPPEGVQYCNRELSFAHKIDHNDICFKIFAAHGWSWGGDWINSKDYQHFYKDVSNPVKTAVKGVVRAVRRAAADNG